MAENFRKNKAINRLQKFKAIRRKDQVEDSSASKFYVSVDADGSNDVTQPLEAAMMKSSSRSVSYAGNTREAATHRSTGVNTPHVLKRPQSEYGQLAGKTTTSAVRVVTGDDDYSTPLNPDTGTTQSTRLSTCQNTDQHVHYDRRVLKPDSVIKPRSKSFAQQLLSREASYVESLNSHDLSGRASLSSRDLVFGIPPPPVRPPRITALSVEMPLQKSSSSQDIGSKTDERRMEQPTTPIPVDILRVMDTLKTMTASDDEGLESESEDSYIAWSDDDDKSITSNSSITSSGTDNIYENMNFRESQIINKAHRIAIELMTTEDNYVQKLEILDKARRKSEELLGNGVAREIFPNINSIYTLHKENMLPHLKERLKSWESNPQIGDIMKTFTPYLKMYTEYVKHFDDALNLVATWNAKHVEFSKMLRSLTPQGASLNLKLQIKAHMLEPIQRVPRYKLLLQQYLKEINEDSTERQDLQLALESVTKAAQHFEDTMKHGTLMGELADIQRQIDCPISLISSTRQMIKQGKIGKVNATTGKVVERYIFLFNDLFLLCWENTWSSFYAYKYKVRQLMEIDGMQIVDGDNLDVPFTFYIKTRKKTVELCASCEAAMSEWREALQKVISDRMRTRLSKDTAVNKRRTMMLGPDNSLGKEAPTWVNNSQVTMCMLCAASFSVIKRKHHCRACGVVACHPCSSHTIPLEYDDFAVHRVCDECFLLLQETSQPIKQHSTFQPTSRDRCVHRGHLQVSPDYGYSWRRRWFEFHADHKLYCYKAQQDINPLMHTHLSQCSIDICDMGDYGYKIIRLRIVNNSSNKTYLLRPEKKEQLAGWTDAFRTISVRDS